MKYNFINNIKTKFNICTNTYTKQMVASSGIVLINIGMTVFNYSHSHYILACFSASLVGWMLGSMVWHKLVNEVLKSNRELIERNKELIDLAFPLIEVKSLDQVWLEPNLETSTPFKLH